MNKLIILFLFTGCNLIEPPTNVSDKLQPFVDQVIYEYNIRGVYVQPIKVVLCDLDNGAAGRYNNVKWDRKIEIDKDFFYYNLNFEDKHILKTLAHEFGHYMGREHNNKMRFVCRPVSLMKEGQICDFEENYEYYFNELVGVEL